MLSIKNKFFIAITIALLSTLCGIGISEYIKHISDAVFKVKLALGEVEHDLMHMNRNEKNFRLSLNTDEVEKFNEYYQRIKKSKENLAEALEDAGIELIELKHLEEEISGYHSSFHNYVSVTQTIGLSPTDGLYGALRDSVHNIEREIKRSGYDALLLVDMLQLRRNEKDFMLRSQMKYIEKFKKNIEIFKRDLKISNLSAGEQLKVGNLLLQYTQSFLALVQGYQKRGLTGDDGMKGKMRKSARDIEASIGDIGNQLNQYINQTVGNLDTFVKYADGIGILLAMVSVYVLFWLRRSVLVPLEELSGVIQNITTNKDLRLRVQLKREDEIGKIGNHFNEMLESIQNLVHKIVNVSSALENTSTNLTKVCQEVDKGVHDSDSETKVISGTVEQLLVSINDISNFARATSDSATQTTADTQQGAGEVQRVSDTMNNLETQVTTVSDAINRVEKDIVEISSVLVIIQGIAEQTNLLALNAAIEAARAGEMGRGFAVVADEVRTLAGRTHEATQDINSKIEVLQSGASEAVNLMQQSLKNTQDGAQMSNHANDNLHEVTRAIEAMNQKIIEIANTTNNQQSLADQIEQNVGKIRSVVQQTGQHSKTNWDYSGNMNKLAVELDNLIGEFKI